MESSSRVQQLYGYSVCLVAIITGLIAISSLTDAAFALADPLRAEGYRYSDRGTFVSYESYAAANPEHRLVRQPSSAGQQQASFDTLSVEQAQERFALLRADRISQVRHDAIRNLVGYGLLLATALALFVGHWMWLRRVTNPHEAHRAAV